jgi:hypothetical protein
MSKEKKDLTGGMLGVFTSTKSAAAKEGTEEKRGPGRPKSEQSDDEERATFIINKDLIEDIKNISYWNRKLLKETVNDALAQYVEKYKSEHKGKIEDRPEEVKTRDGKRSNAGRR